MNYIYKGGSVFDREYATTLSISTGDGSTSTNSTSGNYEIRIEAVGVSPIITSSYAAGFEISLDTPSLINTLSSTFAKTTDIGLFFRCSSMIPEFKPSIKYDTVDIKAASGSGIKINAIDSIPDDQVTYTISVDSNELTDYLGVPTKNKLLNGSLYTNGPYVSQTGFKLVGGQAQEYFTILDDIDKVDITCKKDTVVTQDYGSIYTNGPIYSKGLKLKNGRTGSYSYSIMIDNMNNITISASGYVSHHSTTYTNGPLVIDTSAERIGFNGLLGFTNANNGAYIDNKVNDTALPDTINLHGSIYTNGAIVLNTRNYSSYIPSPNKLFWNQTIVKLNGDSGDNPTSYLDLSSTTTSQSITITPPLNTDPRIYTGHLIIKTGTSVPSITWNGVTTWLSGTPVVSASNTNIFSFQSIPKYTSSGTITGWDIIGELSYSY